MNCISDSAEPIDAVVFDLGGVLIDWNPRHLYRKIFGADESAMETFLKDVCNTAWNEQQDKGRSWADAIAEAIGRHPSHASNIRAYFERWSEMLAGQIEGTVEILEELKGEGVRLLALTNWSGETFPVAQERFPFLSHFEGILVSGHERMMKPDPAIFNLLVERYKLTAGSTLFIDDSIGNVESATRTGLIGLHFQGPEKLRADLRLVGLPIRDGGAQRGK